LNGANGQADRQRQRHLLSAHRRHRQNMAGHLHASWARVQVRVQLVVLRIFRNRVAAGDLKIKNSALRRLQAQERLTVAVLNSGRHLAFAALTRRRPWASLAVKHAAEVRLLVNPVGRPEVGRLLLQPSASLDNQSAETKNQKDQHRRQGHSNFWRNCRAAPERNFGAAFFQASFVGRLCQTLTYDLLVVGKTFLIWPLFPMRDQTSSDWILSNVVPLFVK
jgi:hypothetical protein